VAQQRSTEIKVGIFLLVCVSLMVGMIVKFGKFERMAAKLYEINVQFPNASGIVKDANVMLAGIGVGKVTEIHLQEDATMHVKLKLAIYQGVNIRHDAQFVINQSGLLGDRYVDVVPRGTTAPYITPGETVEGQSTTDLSEAIRSVVEVLHQTAGTIERIDGLVKRLDGAVHRVDEYVLSSQTLNHVVAMVANIDATTSNAASVMASLRLVVDNSRVSISNTLWTLSLAADNVNFVTKRADTVVVHADEFVHHLDSLVLTNRDDIRTAATNLAASAQRLNGILYRLESGEGTAGKLLTDSALHDELKELLDKLNRYGLLYNTWIGPKLKEPQPARHRPDAPPPQ